MLHEETKDILKAGISISNALADGFQISDLVSLIDLPAAISDWRVGVDELKKSIDTKEGRAEIVAYVEEYFDIPNDHVEDVIEKTIAWLDSTYGLYLTWAEV